MTTPHETQIATDPQSTLSQDRQAREKLGEDLAAAAKQVFARMSRGTNGYAGGHVESLGDFLNDTAANQDKFVRAQAAAKARAAALIAKGGY